MVPDFFVIGAYRSGTTSLYRDLRQHPEVFLPPMKEPNFFAVDGNPSAGASLRRRSVCEPVGYAALFTGARGGQRTGDISPEYLCNPWTAHRLAEVAPGAPLVAVLRDPVERAWSDFLLHVRDGDEPARRLRDALGPEPAGRGCESAAARYLAPGFYARQLARYLELFPRAQLQVHLFDDLRADRAAVLAQVFDHIGVDPAFVPEPEAPVNASGVPRSAPVAAVLRARGALRPYVNRSLVEWARPAWERFLSTRLERPELDDEDRALLVDAYRDEVHRLGDLLDRDLSHWARC